MTWIRCWSSGLQEDMLGVKTTMHLADAMELARQQATGHEDRMVLGVAQGGPLFQQRIQVIPATQRLRFYMQYRRRKHLSASDKQRIRHVLKFFEGRE